MKRSYKVMIAYEDADLAAARELDSVLRTNGFETWAAFREILPGDVILESLRAAIKSSDFVILLLSRSAILNDGSEFPTPLLGLRLEAVFDEVSRLDRQCIPVLVEDIAIPEELRGRAAVKAEPDEPKYGLRIDSSAVVSSLRLLVERQGRTESTDWIAQPDTSYDAGRSLRIRSLKLTNIRCFEHLDLPFARWTTVLGDNATGKSTILRAVALGLCNESDTVALMKEVPGTFLRDGADEGAIVLTLVDEGSGEELEIETTLKRDPDRPDEEIRKHTTPEEDFPWTDLFVCGYGTQRSRQSHAGHERYSVRHAVATLFDDAASLQNPELVLLRQHEAVRLKIEARLLDVLMLDAEHHGLSYGPSGARIDGPWGSQSFRTLSDGYRSTSQWMLDFMAWLVQAGRLNGRDEAGGLLIIDELEQHLHPRWQRYIVKRLREQFPRIQILVSTHTPLVAAGTSDMTDAKLFRLLEGPDGLECRDIPRHDMIGLRADQILSSAAFGLQTTRSPGSTSKIQRYAELKGKGELTSDEAQEAAALKHELGETFELGETDFERRARDIVRIVMDKMSFDEDPELVDLETRRRLQELFSEDTDEGT